jgi:hypothetical protein
MTVASPSMSPISKRPAEAVPVEKGCAVTTAETLSF